MLIVAFEESTTSKTIALQWCSRFKKGRKEVNDCAYPGRPSMLTTDKNIEAVKKMILDNCRITIREVFNDVGSC